MEKEGTDNTDLVHKVWSPKRNVHDIEGESGYNIVLKIGGVTNSP